MNLVGMYHIALLPAADEKSFAARLADGPQPQLTRVTSSVTTRLLKRTDQPRRYAWQVNVVSMAHGYQFEDNLERLQEHINDFGVVLGVDAFAEVSSDPLTGG
jgi:hypothetical protein